MSRDWKYGLLLAGALFVYLLLYALAPKQLDWTVSYGHADKRPFGGYVLNDLLPDIFPVSHLSHSDKTIYEIAAEKDTVKNYLIITSQFDPDPEDLKVILKHVSAGGNAFISSEYWNKNFMDTLGVNPSTLFYELFSAEKGEEDSLLLHLSNPRFDTTQSYTYQSFNVPRYFKPNDSIPNRVIARNENQQAVTLLFPYGKGKLILNCTPLMFTNHYLLYQDNRRFVSRQLSYLPPSSTLWTEYYHAGHFKAGTPLRLILTDPNLSWAYYTLLATVLLFILFEIKRKQRVVPVIEPPQNTTLQFVKTIGNLYFQRKDHHHLALKKIEYFRDYLKNRLFLVPGEDQKLFMEQVAAKCNLPLKKVQRTFELIQNVENGVFTYEVQLQELNEHINLFYRK